MSEPVQTKTCSKCKTSKAIDQFGRHKGRSDGLNNWCKECVLQDSRRKKPLKPKILVPDGKKHCSTCKVFKDTSEFGKHKGAKDGLNTRCKTCIVLSKRKSRANDPKNKEKQRTYKLNNVLQHILYNCEGIDKRKGRVCDLDEAYINQLVKAQNGLNLYTNTPIKWMMDLNKKKNTGAHNGSSIDRIDSTKGHIKGNVQIIELWVNRLKLEYNMKTFGKILRRLRDPPEPVKYKLDFSKLPRFQKVFLWNKINNTKQRQKKMTKSEVLGFTLDDVLELWEEQERKCALSSIPINIYPNNPYSISIDRIDSDKPYSKDNIHLTSWVVNSARSDMSLDEFSSSLECIRSNSKQKDIYDADLHIEHLYSI